MADQIQKLLNQRIDFHQDQPRLGNQFEEDDALHKYLGYFLESGKFEDSQLRDLKEFGGKVASRTYLDMSYDAESNKPTLENHDAWGRRIDKLNTSQGWKYLKNQAGVERLIGLAYNEQDKELKNRRFHQMLKLYLFSQSSGLVSCPLAMTDGAAFTIRELQRQKSKYFSQELREAYERLTTYEPEKFWTSGQWMTEKRGGSDVTGGTETFGLPESGSELSRSPETTQYRAYGYKWFSSATDADMTLALCRFPVTQQELESNSGKLGLAFIKIRDADGNLNGIQILRLKDKMGTRQLPTAELLLNGARALRISDIGQGVKQISSMLNVTRMHNSVSAVSGMRRVLALAVDYSHRRTAFGSLIEKKPLQAQTLVQMELKFRGNLLFLLQMIQFLQEQDTLGDQNKDLFRISTSALKVFTAKEAVTLISEGLECFGGLGYMENSKIPVLYRDAQVLTIWEGTTNVLSLDFVKTVAKDVKRFQEIFSDFTSQNQQVAQTVVSPNAARSIQDLQKQFIADIHSSLQGGATLLETNARKITFNYSFLFVLTVILSKVLKNSSDSQEIALFEFWLNRAQKEYQAVLTKDQLKENLQISQKFIQKPNYGKDKDSQSRIRQRL